MTSLSAHSTCPLTHSPPSIRIAAQTWPDSAAAAEPSESTFAQLFLVSLLRWWVLPAVLLVAATLLLTTGGLDIALARLFYSGATCDDDWAGQYQEPWHALYRLGPAPGLALGIAGAVVVIGSFVTRRWRRHRSAGLFLAVLLAVGPGMLINGILKPKWGRPRPCQIAEFGGQQVYLPCWQSGTDPVSRSFPSGHASMGFYLIAPAFFLVRNHRRAALGFVVLGLTVGGSIGLARVVQGRHFPSDVLWSLGCIYFSGLALSVVFRRAFQRSAAFEQQPTMSLVRIASMTVDGADTEAHDEGFDSEPLPSMISIEAARDARARPSREQQFPVPQRRAA